MIRLNLESVAILIKRAMNMLHEYVSRFNEGELQTSSAILEKIETLLIRMESQMLSVDHTHSISNSRSSSYAPIVNENTIELHPPILTRAYSDIPESFTSSADAQDRLEFYNHLYNLASTGTWSELTIIDPYSDALDRWSAAMNAYYLKRVASLSGSEMFTTRVLEVYRLINAMALDAMSRYSTFDSPIVWDNYTGVFSEAVGLIEGLQQSFQGTAAETNCEPIFTLNLGIVGPLYHIAMQCRDPHIRRRAIRVLYTWHRREGVRDSVLAARAAEAIMIAEEDGQIIHTCSDIPAWRRITAVVIDYQLDKKSCAIRYRRRVCAANPMTMTIEKIVHWD